MPLVRRSHPNYKVTGLSITADDIALGGDVAHGWWNISVSQAGQQAGQLQLLTKLEVMFWMVLKLIVEQFMVLNIVQEP